MSVLRPPVSGGTSTGLLRTFSSDFEWTTAVILDETISSTLSIYARAIEALTPGSVGSEHSTESMTPLDADAMLDAIYQSARSLPAYKQSALHIAEQCTILRENCRSITSEQISRLHSDKPEDSLDQLTLVVADDMLRRDLDRVRGLLSEFQAHANNMDTLRPPDLLSYALDYLLLPRPFFNPPDEERAESRHILKVVIGYDENQLRLAGLRAAGENEKEGNSQSATDKLKDHAKSDGDNVKPQRLNASPRMGPETLGMSQDVEPIAEIMSQDAITINKKPFAMGGHGDMSQANQPLSSFAIPGVYPNAIEEFNDTDSIAEVIKGVDSITIKKKPFASGGNADVFEGEWCPPGQTDKILVAIKVLRLDGMHGTAEEEAQLERVDKRLGREMRVWGELNHPRIVPLLGYMRSKNEITGHAPCLVAPFYAFKNLEFYLSRHPDADRIALLHQAAEGLNYLHTLDPPIVHLDIKPANVLIDDSGKARICDFGVSRVLDGIKTGLTTGNSKYTLSFSCPEILNGLPGTPASDVFSFAGLALQALSGNAPYHTLSSAAQIMIAIMTGRNPYRNDYAIQLRPESLDMLWALLGSCWKTEPLTRPPMKEVMMQLEFIHMAEVAD